MNKAMLILALLGALGLSACNKKPDVVNVTPAPVVTPEPVVVPGPAGPQGETGSTGATGKSGDGSTVIVMPPASAPASAPAN